MVLQSAAGGATPPARPAPAWNPRALAVHAGYAAVAGLLEQLPADRLPGLAELDALVSRGMPADAGDRSMQRIRIVAPLAPRTGAAAYERRIRDQGEVPTRPDSVHDLFNALAWIAWPRTKRALNRVQAEEIDAAVRSGAPSGRRGRRRDQATLFDEDGLIVACADPALAGLLRTARWRELFVERRDTVLQAMTFLGLGHALLDKLRRPWKALTARTLIVPVDPAFAALPRARQAFILDCRAADAVAQPSSLLRPDGLIPVPVLGIPGWTEENRQPGFYDDPRVFRPRTTSRNPASIDPLYGGWKA